MMIENIWCLVLKSLTYVLGQLLSVLFTTALSVVVTNEVNSAKYVIVTSQN